MAKTKSSLYASLNYSLILMKDIQKIDKLLVNWSFSKRPAGGASSVRFLSPASRAGSSMTRLWLCWNNQSLVQHRIMIVNDMLATAIFSVHLSLIAAIVGTVIKRMIVLSERKSTFSLYIINK